MNNINKILDFITKNQNKSIALFIDMDGTIASIDIDLNNNISKNTPKYFLHKRPLKSIINILREISHKQNITPFILSACVFKEQAKEKELWLKKNIDFIDKNNYLFAIKEKTKYTPETKKDFKIGFIRQTLKQYDLAIYIEDEYLMLQHANKLLKNRILCIHISEFID